MKEIKTDKAPAAIGPYSQAVDLEQMVYLSGQIPIHPETGELPETIEEQTAQALNNVKSILEEIGQPMSAIVKTTVFLTDMNDFAAMNGVYEGFFSKPYPARSCAQAAALPKGAKVEIECIATRLR